MEKHIKTLAIVFVFVAISFVAYIGINRPSTFEDCILKNMGDTKNEQAANYIRVACRNKFPEEKRYLSEEEVYGKK